MSRHLTGCALTLCLLACGNTSHQPPPPAAIAPAAQRPSEERVIRLGYQKIGVPFLLKQRAGELNARLHAFHARAEWVEYQAGLPLLEAMRSGAVDIGYVGETPPVFAQADDVPLLYIASDAPAPAAEAILVPKNSTLHSVAELKGKRVGLNRGSNVQYLLVRALEAAGLTLDDVQVTYAAPQAAREAFDSGKLDAWVIWDPFQAEAELDGARMLRDGTGLVDNRFYYLARRDFAETQPQLLAHVLDTYSTLSTWAKAHPEDAARMLAESTGLAYEALLRAEKRHNYAIGRITPEILDKQQIIANTFHTLRLIPKAIKLKDAFVAQAAYDNGS